MNSNKGWLSEMCELLMKKDKFKTNTENVGRRYRGDSIGITKNGTAITKQQRQACGLENYRD